MKNLSKLKNKINLIYLYHKKLIKITHPFSKNKEKRLK